MWPSNPVVGGVRKQSNAKFGPKKVAYRAE
jgi:hypothetical protein